MIPGSQMPNGNFTLSSREMSLVLMSMENIARTPRSRLCLFGRSDPAETAKLLADEFDHDRRKIISRYGFDILTEMPVESIKQPSETRVRKIDLTEDKENINFDALKAAKDDEKCLKPLKPKKMKKNGDGEKKKSIKNKGAKPYDKNDRQALVSDYWPARKFSESSSCSEKEN